MGKSIKKEIMKNDPSCAVTPQEKIKFLPADGNRFPQKKADV